MLDALLPIRPCAQERGKTLAQEIAEVEQEVDKIEAQALATIPSVTPGSSQRLPTLGKMLFFDKNLSVERNEACAFCHMPQTGFQPPSLVRRSQSDRRFAAPRWWMEKDSNPRSAFPVQRGKIQKRTVKFEPVSPICSLQCFFGVDRDGHEQPMASRPDAGHGAVLLAGGDLRAGRSTTRIPPDAAILKKA